MMLIDGCDVGWMHVKFSAALGCARPPCLWSETPPSVWRHDEGSSVGMLCISYQNCSSADTLTNDNGIRQLRRNCKGSSVVSSTQIIIVVIYFSAKKYTPTQQRNEVVPQNVCSQCDG